MRTAAAAALCLWAADCAAQQVPDRDYQPPIERPRHAPGTGPMICVDEAHFNFHTLEGRFFAFGELLRRDGYRTRASTAKFSATALAACRVLVISNAQPSADGWNNYPFPTPSAFTDAEILAVRAWVEAGGSLLLIADHMPLAGAAAQLAAAFHVEFHDGFAQREPETDEPDIFSTAAGTLRDHAVTRLEDGTALTAVRTFTGQAFRAPHATPLLVFPAGYVQFMPRKAWEFNRQTPRIPVAGWLQGAVLTQGKGRAGFFGEAAMFSAQLAGSEKTPVGMNSPGAGQNFQFTLNLLHWLSQTE
jgi:hypothetical protein